MNYLAYGSNLHPARLRARTPSARLLSIAALPGWRLAFHKRSRDGSSKCNIVHSGRPTDMVYGALYRLTRNEKFLLDRYEGLGSGYHEMKLSLPGHGDVFFYSADQAYIDESLKPYDWYKRLVLLGAAYHDFPASYIIGIEAVTAVADPDRARQRENLGILPDIVNSPL